MKYLGQEILTTTEKIRDDAFVIFMPQFMAEKKVVFRVDELKMVHAMIVKSGMISAGKKYIQLTYQWEGSLWYFNASTTFDELCLKYKFYPRYLAERDTHEILQGEPTEFKDDLPF